MAERHIDADEEFSKIEPRQTASSAGRNWFGYEAGIFETTRGYLERAATPDQHISMHVGPPVRARFRSNGTSKQFIQGEGHIIIVPAGCPATWEGDADATFIVADFKPRLIRLVAEELDIAGGIFAIVPHAQLRDPQVEHIFWALKTELEQGDASDHLFADSLGLTLATQLLRRYAVKSSQSSCRKFSKGQVRRAIDYIRENLDGDLSLRQIANASGVSLSHLKSLFKESTGMAVHRFVVQNRVEIALELLLSSELSIAEVAARTGFTDQSHLSRCMRRVLGVSPGTVSRERNGR